MVKNEQTSLAEAQKGTNVVAKESFHPIDVAIQMQYSLQFLGRRPGLIQARRLSPQTNLVKFNFE